MLSKLIRYLLLTLILISLSSWFESKRSKANLSLKINSIIEKQEAIGICVNFNFEPDDEGNSLSSILRYYTIIHRFIVILSPKPFHQFNEIHLNLFRKYNLIQQKDLSLSKSLDTIYYIECLNQRSGQLQHKCLLLCAQFYDNLKRNNHLINMEGILYLPDDIFLNYSYIFSQRERFPLNEIWTTPWMQKLDLITNDKGQRGNRWFWWKHRPHFWQSFKELFDANSTKLAFEYKQIFEILYGKQKRLAIGIADLIYLPFADHQLNNFISISKYFIEILPSDIFCEIIISLIIDTTMAMSQHWPYENDFFIFNSSVNRLNRLKSSRMRPCPLNPDGYIWGRNRHNQQLYFNGVFNGIVPLNHLSKPWPFPTEFIHPMKLSNRNHWISHLWHKAMNKQIELLRVFQMQPHLVESNSVRRPNRSTLGS